MKHKLPAFLEGIESPVDGEVAMRKFAAQAGENAVVVGIDEVGRGPLAGPVVACAAVLKAPDALLTLNDSKKLTRVKREAMYQDVQDACACFAVASASVEEIDRMNILEADFLAMRRALQALGMPGLHESAPEIPIFKKGSFDKTVRVLIAVDGNLKIHGIPEEMQIPVVKGDGRIASISAASILAKVFRDRYMDDLEKKFPGYGFDKHAGYGTKAHLEAIRRQGMTPEHRKSFHPKSLQTELDL
ncbi:ribonuclease HII [uncultured Fibrobacter sp.]|uniref:ribonuclease HII n=1 Tax=uncultured Fibrobacter sp. TaxID=261512 RepID=UPI00261686A1|nr:ribonuclease HII [uncultured Fibrobacter sp.]